MTTEATGVRCKSCRKGIIVEETTKTFIPLFGPPIDGPGHEKQWEEKKSIIAIVAVPCINFCQINKNICKN